MRPLQAETETKQKPRHRTCFARYPRTGFISPFLGPWRQSSNLIKVPVITLLIYKKNDKNFRKIELGAPTGFLVVDSREVWPLFFKGQSQGPQMPHSKDIGALPQWCRPQVTRIIGTQGVFHSRSAIPRRFNRGFTSS